MLKQIYYYYYYYYYINLQQVIFWPSNILELFQRFGVKKEFDFLSVDTDSYDWFMIETILEAGYRPRVIVTEINAKYVTNLELSLTWFVFNSFGMLEAKSILPPKDKKSWKRWDGTTYHGSSMLAMSYLFNRFEYSVLFCNYINCFAVRYVFLFCECFWIKHWRLHSMVL